MSFRCKHTAAEPIKITVHLFVSVHVTSQESLNKFSWN